MNPADKYVKYFYKKFKGRVALAVGYNQNLSEIYPFVFEDSDENSIGLVALGLFEEKNNNYVHIYHIGSFKTRFGYGSRMLRELCLQADKHQIVLTLSPIFMPDGENEPMSDEKLRKWYGKFGFGDSSPFKREPRWI